MLLVSCDTARQCFYIYRLFGGGCCHPWTGSRPDAHDGGMGRQDAMKAFVIMSMDRSSGDGNSAAGAVPRRSGPILGHTERVLPQAWKLACAQAHPKRPARSELRAERSQISSRALLTTAFAPRLPYVCEPSSARGFPTRPRSRLCMGWASAGIRRKTDRGCYSLYRERMARLRVLQGCPRRLCGPLEHEKTPGLVEWADIGGFPEPARRGVVSIKPSKFWAAVHNSVNEFACFENVAPLYSC